MKKIQSALSLTPALSSTLCLCFAEVLVSCGSDSPGPAAPGADLRTCGLLPAADVQGICDLAYTFQVWESVHLAAYWDTYYTVWLWTNVDADQKDRALQWEKTVAQLIMDKL